ncbi:MULTISPECIES: ABC transporter ATP-binding protein [Clostridium]|uniref:ABC transporter ATP-binding protein n=1 Tax=Clostridium TaxID=1485 RepID=UPI000BE4696E|nr:MULTISPECIES: ABC transporter ATP-binding protein [Clostridium]MDI9215406.1 ABC transporter ATP-binding protein/permease [Clostridium tertium]MDU1565889.1 ABC transporter ATP-binding protein [Clostridium sp.]MDU4739157.1 ABC transporter ATP-binding protein [Clostridium sp.]MDU7362649.1 ABC transporter ATP-binding protein [Clostridium sp.]MDY4603805.1 ABC transporter ATP-binding protein [Clostridium tertium]
MNISLVKRIIKYTKPYNKYIIIAFFSAIINITLTLLTPIIIGKGVDLIIGQGNVNFNRLFKTLIPLSLTVIFSSIFQLVMTRCTNIVSYKTIKDIRVDVFNKLNALPLKYIDSNSHGSIINGVINDIEIVSDGLLQGFSQLFTGVITIIGTLIFMISINIKIALIVVIITPLSLFTASTIAKYCYSMFRKQSQVRGELSGYVEEMIGNQKVVKAFSFEERSQETFEEINKRLYKYGQKAQFYSALTNPCTRFVNGIVYAAVGIIGAISAINGTITIGQLSSFLSYANQYTKPFNEISGVITELQAAFASASRVFKILDENEEIPDCKNSINLTSCEGYIDINNVSFSYSNDKNLIENFNLKVKPGDKIAIVGPTGCGKTTLINLLMRFYNINSGEINIDNINIDNITRSSTRGLYGMVLQDTWLYSGTVRENIAYGKPDASLEEVILAAKNAHAHKFIMNLPNGYDTILTDDSSLSQGQKQLLCIARVMLSKPPMLILDEATSSIDTRTEIYIQRAFNKLMEGRTTFIVAHRLSTIREADLILVMNNGKVIEQGNHDELLNKGGFYANLYNSQFALI